MVSRSLGCIAPTGAVRQASERRSRVEGWEGDESRRLAVCGRRETIEGTGRRPGPVAPPRGWRPAEARVVDAATGRPDRLRCSSRSVSPRDPSMTRGSLGAL